MCRNQLESDEEGKPIGMKMFSGNEPGLGFGPGSGSGSGSGPGSGPAKNQHPKEKGKRKLNRQTGFGDRYETGIRSDMKMPRANKRM